jgi:hypothetical protein
LNLLRHLSSERPDRLGAASAVEVIVGLQGNLLHFTFPRTAFAADPFDFNCEKNFSLV